MARTRRTTPDVATGPTARPSAWLWLYRACAGLTAVLPVRAEAHVKWFCAYDVAGQPLGLENVLCPDFEWLVGIAVVGLLLAGLIERLPLGAVLTQFLDACTVVLDDYGDVVLRSSLSFFFVALWMIGGIVLTPELTSPSLVIPWLQLAVAACLLRSHTLPLASLGIISLFAVATLQYGVFHMLDYPVFLGIAAYLAMVGSARRPFGLRPADALRWSVAVTLMWASVEKWAYPAWSYPLLIQHPSLGSGWDPDHFMRAAGSFEFTMAFALFCTPLIRRLAALSLVTIFVAAIFTFGPIDAIGHAPVIGALLVLVGDRGMVRRPVGKIGYMPLHYAGTLGAFLAAYYGVHAAMFGTALVT